MSFASAASSSAVTPVIRTEEDSSRRSSSTMSSASRIACSCWRAMTSSVACGVHVRVAVPVAADPRAERERARVDGELDADARELVVERLERVRHRVVMQRVEVVDGVAGLVDRLGAHDAQLVRLPEQVDELLEAAPDPALGDRVDRQAVGPERALPLVEQRGDPADLRQHAAARRLGRVGGEDRAQVQVAQVGGDLAGGVPGGLDPVDRLLQPASRARAGRPRARGRGGPARRR